MPAVIPRLYFPNIDLTWSITVGQHSERRLALWRMCCHDNTIFLNLNFLNIFCTKRQNSLKRLLPLTIQQ